MALSTYHAYVLGKDVTACDVLGTTYYLFTKPVTLKNGARENVYYFIQQNSINNHRASDQQPTTIPSGYEVIGAEHNGMPVLKRK